MTIFRSRGFDSLIGKGTVIRGIIDIQPDSVMQIDGLAEVDIIQHGDEGMGDVAGMGHRIAPKTTLHVNGEVRQYNMPLEVTVHNVIVAGKLQCDKLRVEGTLAIKAGATIDADQIYYRNLVIENGAVVHGQMFHLDHLPPVEPDAAA